MSEASRRRSFTIFIALLILLTVVVAVYYVSTFNRVGLCENKKEITGRDACFLTLAGARRNVTFCDNLSTEDGKFRCYSLVGKSLNDTKICEKIPVNAVDYIALHDNCLMCIAVTQRNETMCMAFSNSITADECLTQLERKVSLTC